jgi:hypothetical protein
MADDKYRDVVGGIGEFLADFRNDAPSLLGGECRGDRGDETGVRGDDFRAMPGSRDAFYLFSSSSGGF